jgi:hypothetical protein
MHYTRQEHGEHARCGPGFPPRCGFTYRPETFMRHDIRHVNMAWPDMSVPTLRRMLDICHVIDHVVDEGGKVAVHCRECGNQNTIPFFMLYLLLD